MNAPSPPVVRRVVTGHDERGRSVVVADDPVSAQLFPGGAACALWGRDDPARFPDDGTEPPWRARFPPVGGIRLHASMQFAGQAEQRNRHLLSLVADADSSGMHRTKSLDLVVVGAGQVRLDMDSGASTVLQAGDVVVQNGTRHRWTNVGKETSVLYAGCVGALTTDRPEAPWSRRPATPTEASHMADGDSYSIRRVVTGHDADGRSVFVEDERVHATDFSGGAIAFLWGRDDAPVYPDDGAQPPWTEAFPPKGGVRLSYSRLLPGCVEEYDAFVAGAVPGDPVAGMHRTRSLDLDIVIEGELTLELEDGVKVRLQPGDVVIQNGTRHRWCNEGAVPVVLAAICLGADNSLVVGGPDELRFHGQPTDAG